MLTSMICYSSSSWKEKYETAIGSRFFLGSTTTVSIWPSPLYSKGNRKIKLHYYLKQKRNFGRMCNLVFSRRFWKLEEQHLRLIRIPIDPNRKWDSTITKLTIESDSDDDGGGGDFLRKRRNRNLRCTAKQPNICDSCSTSCTYSKLPRPLFSVGYCW